MPFEVSFELYNRPALPLLRLRKQRAALYRSKYRGLAAYRSYCTVAAHIFHNGQPGHVWIFPFCPGRELAAKLFSIRCRICILPPQIALLPQLLCRGEQLWGDCWRTDRAADCVHGLAHRVEEGARWRSPSGANDRRPEPHRVVPWQPPHHNRHRDRVTRL